MTTGLAAARGFIDEVRWKYASTMPKWPHEYTIKEWRPELADEFEAFCRLIASEGLRRTLASRHPERPIYHNRYLVIGQHKYWGMGDHGDKDRPEDMTVLNRAVHDPAP